MSSMQEADWRIEQKERELARIQSEVTTPAQLEANLSRESLQSTLATAAVFADAVIKLLDVLGHDLEKGLGRTGDGLTGRTQEKP